MLSENMSMGVENSELDNPFDIYGIVENGELENWSCGSP